MSYLEIDSDPDSKVQLFPKGDLADFFQKVSVPLLGELPFNPQVGLASESGMPIVWTSPKAKITERFMQIAEGIVGKIK